MRMEQWAAAELARRENAKKRALEWLRDPLVEADREMVDYNVDLLKVNIYF